MRTLDSMANRWLPEPAVLLNQDFTPSQTIQGCEVVLQPDSAELAVIIPAWHVSALVQWQLIRKQVALGRSVISYRIHDEILNPDPQVTVDCFQSIADRVADDITVIHNNIRNTVRMRFIAGSLGNAILPYVMGEKGLEGDVDSFAPGHDLAESFCEGTRTQHLWKYYQSQGITRSQLKHLGEPLSPTYQAANNIRNSSFRLYASASDKVIPSAQLGTYADALVASGNRVQLFMNRHLGHYGTIVKESLLYGLSGLQRRDSTAAR